MQVNKNLPDKGGCGEGGRHKEEKKLLQKEFGNGKPVKGSERGGQSQRTFLSRVSRRTLLVKD